MIYEISINECKNYCIECGKKLGYFNLLLKNNKIQKVKAFSLKPFVYNNTEYYRNLCIDCFYKKEKRLPSKKLTYDYCILLNIDKEILKNFFKEKAHTLNNFIKKYGNINGLRKWNEYCEKQRITNTFEYKKKKYNWNEKKFKEYNLSRSITLSNMIKKYGNINGLRKWNEYCEKQRTNGNKIEYFINKFGYQDGIIKYYELNKKKVLNKNNFIKKYGKENGLKKYIEYINNKNKDYFSKVSQKLFWQIYFLIKEKYNKIYFAELNNEFGLLNENTYYKYDFVILDNKKCIEFNGDIFHANPRLFLENDTPNPFNKNLTAKDIWKKDHKKILFLTKNGFNVKIIWESDYKRYKDKIIEEIIKWIIQ